MIVNHIVEIEMDYCQHTFGTAPCTASGAVQFACFNTLKTCQSPSDYTKATNTYRFSEAENGVYENGVIPCILDIDMSPTAINPKKGLDYLGSVSISLMDFSHNDVGSDKYYAARNYIAADQGTFFGRFLARNPYYLGRKLRIKQVVDGVVKKTYLFFIESITPPDYKGRVKIEAKDPLFLAGSGRSKAPKATDGKLSADITETSSTLPIVDASTKYPPSGTVILGDEIIQYSGATSTELTGLTRGQWGTEIDDHQESDNVQLCLIYDDVPVSDILYDLLSNYTAISTQLLDKPAWDSEFNQWLQVYRLKNIITEPTDVLDLIAELQNETGSSIWWDQEDQKIKLKANIARTQLQNIRRLNDVADLMMPIKSKELIKERISQYWIYFGRSDYSKSNKDEKNYRNLDVRVDEESESENQYGVKKIDVLYAKWLTGSAQAGQAATRKLNAYKRPTRQLTFSLSQNSGDMRTGDNFYLQTATIQSPNGQLQEVEMKMLSMQYMPMNLSFQCKANIFQYDVDQIFAFIAPNNTPDYSAATDAQKQSRAFICNNDGKMPNGKMGYLIV